MTTRPVDFLPEVPGEVGDNLAGQREGGGAVRLLDANLVGTRGLVTVGGAHHEHAGHRAEGREVLDGLVGGVVLTDADGVVGHDEQRGAPESAAMRMAERM